jgi:hypothetical protein
MRKRATEQKKELFYRDLFEVVGAEINRPMAFVFNKRLSNNLKRLPVVQVSLHASFDIHPNWNIF